VIKLIVLILFSIPSSLLAQQPKAFRIIGHSIYYNNQRLTIQGGMFFPSYNDFEFAKDNIDTSGKPYKSIQVQNNRFTISGTLKYPHPFTISYYNPETEQGYSSYVFFVDQDNLTIELNDLSKIKNLGSHFFSKSNYEYYRLKKLYSNSVDTITGAVYNMQEKQKILQKYIKNHPDSYVALWDMVLDYSLFKNDSIKKTFLINAQFFSSEIKKTRTYQAFVTNIELDFELVVGKIFPNFPLNSVDSLYQILNKNKFTLVDFWFSGCKPCLEQFPDLTKIYSTFKENQFEITGISVDVKKDIGNWQKIIKKFDLAWLQYLDTDGKETDKLLIRKFPTNFLLNRKGEIIRKDISLDDLETFLQNNLNSQDIKQ